MITKSTIIAIVADHGDEFFEQFAELLPGPVDRHKLADVALANWVDFVGPPLTVSDPI